MSTEEIIEERSPVENSRVNSIPWRNLLLELLVVFVGVFAAFWFESYREAKAERAHKVIYFNAFLLELEKLQANTENLKKDIDGMIELHRAKPETVIEFHHQLDFTNTIYIVESAFYNDNFSGIHSEFMMNLEFGANQIKRLDKRLDELRQEIRQAKFTGIASSEPFRNWFLGELHYLSARLQRLIETIENGAVPETRQIVSGLEG